MVLVPELLATYNLKNGRLMRTRSQFMTLSFPSVQMGCCEELTLRVSQLGCSGTFQISHSWEILRDQFRLAHLLRASELLPNHCGCFLAANYCNCHRQDY